MKKNFPGPIEAIREHDFKAASDLLSMGVGIDARDSGGRDVVGCAKHYANNESDVTEVRKGLTTGLTMLARAGKAEPVAHLAQHAIPAQKSLVYGVPHTLGTAAVISGQVETLKGWLKAGGDPNSQTPIGMTLTGQAVAMNRPDMADALSKANASLTLKDKLGMNPLGYAVLGIKEGFDKCLAVFSDRDEAKSLMERPDLKTSNGPRL